MKTETLRSLTPEEHSAIQAAAWMHGRNFKSVILECWSYGTYSKHCLGDHDGTLQRMRNSGDGRELLASLRTIDFCATPAVAFIMGKNAVTEGGQNPFGVASLANAWRKGYVAARETPTH